MSNDLHVIATIKREESMVLVYHLDKEQFYVFDDTMIMGERIIYQVEGEIVDNQFVFYNIRSMLKQISEPKYDEIHDDALRRGFITSDGITAIPKQKIKEEVIVTEKKEELIVNNQSMEDIAIAEEMEIEEAEEIIEPVSIVEANEVSTSIVGGLPSFAEIKEYLDRYNFVKRNVVDDSDFHEYVSKGKLKKFMKKSGFRKFIHPFGLSVQVVKRESRLYFDATTKRQGIEYEVWARCTAPNGQFTEDVAICQQYEKNSNKSKHDVLTTATTRAINRAIGNLVAYGEVSAEEVM